MGGGIIQQSKIGRECVTLAGSKCMGIGVKFK